MLADELVSPYPLPVRALVFATSAVAKAKLGVPVSATLSEPTTPTNDGVPVTVLARSLSNTLFTPVKPEIVKFFLATVISVGAEFAAK